jgi:hypothetical protein
LVRLNSLPQEHRDGEFPSQDLLNTAEHQIFYKISDLAEIVKIPSYKNCY